MATSAKESAVAELTDLFRSSSAAVLTEYRGLTVSELKQLRDSIRQDATYSVAKNTLTEIAAKEAGVEGLDAHLAGPTAIAFVTGDPVTVAKALRDFAKDHDKLVLKGGYMDGQPLDEADIEKLADLESREVLLAKFAGAMKGSMSKAAALFQAPLSKTARTVEALRAQQDQAA
ncbi:50S ribosomal protein L10 [Micrococcus porci]|uniref:50S ribosomal protein L10 n=1 Tax=Micrococcus porci TaxID=2856555 RepID=UPI003CF60BD3